MSNGRSLDAHKLVASHVAYSGTIVPAEVVLDEIRSESASVGLAIRPSRDYLLQRNTEASSTETEAVQSSACNSPYTSTRTLYLRTRMGRSGVLQIHQACASLVNTAYLLKSVLFAGCRRAEHRGLHFVLQGGRSLATSWPQSALLQLVHKAVTRSIQMFKCVRGLFLFSCQL